VRRARGACRRLDDGCSVGAHFDTPVYATAAPGEPGKLYVVEQAGQIVVLEAGHIRSAPFLDIRQLVLKRGRARRPVPLERRQRDPVVGEPAAERPLVVRRGLGRRAVPDVRLLRGSLPASLIISSMDPDSHLIFR